MFTHIYKNGDDSNLKNWPQAEKITFFGYFLFFLHIYISRRKFFAFNKISYLQPFREIIGGQRIQKFRLKWRRRPKKWLFFGFFFFLLHIYTSRRNFFAFIKNFISSAVQRNHGGTRKKALHRTNERTNERTNKRTTETNYMDDHNTPSGFSESSG